MCHLGIFILQPQMGSIWIFTHSESWMVFISVAFFLDCMICQTFQPPSSRIPWRCSNRQTWKIRMLKHQVYQLIVNSWLVGHQLDSHSYHHKFSTQNSATHEKPTQPCIEHQPEESTRQTKYTFSKDMRSSAETFLGRQPWRTKMWVNFPRPLQLGIAKAEQTFNAILRNFYFCM